MQMGIKEFRHTTKVSAPVKPASVSGICAGAMVMTLRGEVPVETLRRGDKIITRDGGVAVLRDVHAQFKRFTPVRIKAGSLGHARPDKDTLTTPGAQLHVRDWRAKALYGQVAAAVPAERLVDGEFVAHQAEQRVIVHQLVFDHPHVIYADGVEMFISA